MRRKLDGSHPDMPMFLWEHGEKIDLSHYSNQLNNKRHPPTEFRPIEVHFKPDGTKDQRPSLAFVIQGMSGATGFIQLSADMLRPVFRVLQVLDQEASLADEKKGVSDS